MVAIRKNLVPVSKYNIKCPYGMNPQYITIHNTANDASADAEVNYMIGNNNEVSFHVAVDDKEAVQGVPFERNTWNAGDGNGQGNRNSISIEICYSKSGGSRYYQAEGNAIQLVAQLLKERGWGIDRVKKHQDWSGKYCPHRILEEGRWQSFLNAIQTALTPPKPSIVYEAHVQDIGWQGKKRDGETAGTVGQSKRLEALTINVENANAKLEIEAHVQNIGWQPVKTNGEIVGTTGKGLRLEAIKIKAAGFNIMYRVHVQDIGWQDWKRNGDIAGTTGQAKRIEAIEIKLG